MDPLSLEMPPALRDLTTAEAPFAGVLRGGDSPTVWVGAEDFGASPAWSAVDSEHILAPLDSAGTPDGSCVILPHCPVTLDEVVRHGAPSDGALVTVAISALRGAAEADRLGAEMGRWWVTAEGRPVLALTGSLAWRHDTVALLREAADRRTPDSGAAALDAALERAADVIEEPRRLRRETDEIESALFAAAEPEALPTDRQGIAASPAHRTRAAAAAQPVGFATTMRDLVGRLVDVGVAHRVGAALGAVASAVRRPRRPDRARPQPRPRRRRVVLVAGAVATAVILGGALWPSGDAEKPAAADVAGSEAPATPTPSPSVSAPPQPAAASPATNQRPVKEDAGPEDIVTAARALIAEVGSCADDACRSRLWEDPSAPVALPSATGDYAIEVVDEYGGAAAVKIVGAERTQVLVMVRVQEKWLAREVYDLADQP
ncbi:hypothetical protein [Microbacterium sp. 1P06AB]|uniref:hypothetical protein n=1 Tax=Microbacterium sp. 1P06AB TaxID=3132289 RepID=UPI0039A636B2